MSRDDLLLFPRSAEFGWIDFDSDDDGGGGGGRTPPMVVLDSE
jgi:hypothetical protein